MIEIINNRAAVAYLDKYFDALKSVGYVKHGVTERFLAYAFLTDFVDTLYYFMTEQDYCDIDNAMISIFANGGCMLNYSDFCIQRAKIGKPFGNMTLRGTESRTNLRATEDINLRKV